jgi:hypothetical protein
MEKKDDCDCCDCGDQKKSWKYSKHWHKGASSGHMYGLGFLGALFYFLQNVSGLQDALLGIGKAIVWPALVVFKALELLHL